MGPRRRTRRSFRRSNREGRRGPSACAESADDVRDDFGEDKGLERSLEGKKAYVHVIQTSGYNEGQASGASVKISSQGAEGVTLREGDGAYIFVGDRSNVLKVENDGDRSAEVIVFDLE